MFFYDSSKIISIKGFYFSNYFWTILIVLEIHKK